MNLTVSSGQDSGWVVTAVAAEDISDWGGWRSQACSMAAKRPKRACEARKKFCTTLRQVPRSVLVVLWAMYSKQ